MDQRSQQIWQRRWWVIPLAVLVLLGLVVAGVETYLAMLDARYEREYLQAVQAMVDAGIPADRRAWVAGLPVVPDRENLALPFVTAAAAIGRDSVLWQAFQDLRDLPDIGSYRASDRLTADDVLSAFERQRQEPRDPFAELEVELTPEAQSQIQTLTGDWADRPDPDQLSPALQWALLRTVIDDNHAALETTAEARVRGGVPVRASFNIAWDDVERPWFQMEWDDLRLQRELSRLLHAAAVRAAAEGDAAAALEHVRRMLVQARAADAASQTIVDYFIAGITFWNANEALQRVLAALPPPWPRELRSEVASMLALLPEDTEGDVQRLRRVWIGELVMQLDGLTHALEGIDGQAISRREFVRNATYLINYSIQVLPAFNARTHHEASHYIETSGALEAEFPRGEIEMVRSIVPAFERVLYAHFKSVSQRRRTAVQVAIALYRDDHQGQYPPSLDALVPGYLPVVPLDPRTEASPVGYDPHRRRVWTVGENGVDDGGTSEADIRLADPDASSSDVLRQSDEVLLLE